MDDILWIVPIKDNSNELSKSFFPYKDSKGAIVILESKNKKEFECRLWFVEARRAITQILRFRYPDDIKDSLLDSMLFDREDIDEAKELYTQYENKETLVWLELALWKAACIIHFPNSDPHFWWSMEDGYGTL
jgi:hypothetical protein